LQHKILKLYINIKKSGNEEGKYFSTVDRTWDLSFFLLPLPTPSVKFIVVVFDSNSEKPEMLSVKKKLLENHRSKQMQQVNENKHI